MARLDNGFINVLAGDVILGVVILRNMVNLRRDSLMTDLYYRRTGTYQRVCSYGVDR